MIRIGSRRDDEITTKKGGLILGLGGDDQIVNEGGSALIFGGRGDDTITSSDGHDLIFGGRGRDTVDGGAGDDLVFGGRGRDVGIYNVAENAGDHDLYFGGRGRDTLVLDFTGLDWLQADVLADIAAFNAAPVGSAFHFTAFDLKAVSFEELVIRVDGVVVDPATAQVLLLNGDGTLAGAFETIQAAVDAASDGNTVFVRDGIYEEQVVVTDVNNLTITGQSEDGVIVRAPAGLDGITLDDDLALGFSTGNVYGVIAVDGASNVLIENLTVDGDGQGGSLPDSDDNFAGILLHNASGTVDGVTVTGVRDALDGDGNLAGTQRGNAIYVTNDDGTQRAFSLLDSTIQDFQKTGLLVRNGDVAITGNQIDGGAPMGGHTTIGQNGIQLSSGGTGEISGNQITGIGYNNPLDADTFASGILLFDTEGLLVQNNQVTGESSQDVGVFSVGSDNLTVDGNTFTDLARGVNNFGDIDPDSDIDGLANTFTDVDVGLNENPLSTLTNIFVFEGSDIADTLVGAAGNDIIMGEGGADSLVGRDGDDQIEGGAGNDTLIGNNGNDTLEGGADDDLLVGFGGDDSIDGGDGLDTVGFLGLSTNFIISSDAMTGVTTITDNGSGFNQGVDQVRNVEQVLFDDGLFLL